MIVSSGIRRGRRFVASSRISFSTSFLRRSVVKYSYNASASSSICSGIVSSTISSRRGGGDAGLSCFGVKKPRAANGDAAERHEEREGTRAVFMKMRRQLLSEPCGTPIGVFECGGGDILFHELSDLIGQFDDLVEFVCRGRNVDLNSKGAGHDLRSLGLFDFTVCVELGKPILGGHECSSLKLPRVAVVG